MEKRLFQSLIIIVQENKLTLIALLRFNIKVLKISKIPVLQLFPICEYQGTIFFIYKLSLFFAITVQTSTKGIPALNSLIYKRSYFDSSLNIATRGLVIKIHQTYLKVHIKPKKYFQNPIYLLWLEIAEDHLQYQYIAIVVTYSLALEEGAVVAGCLWSFDEYNLTPGCTWGLLVVIVVVVARSADCAKRATKTKTTATPKLLQNYSKTTPKLQYLC